jgi:SAM-dependent methyltransferase
MADWGSGYVTDTAYVHDFCRVQIPAILSFAALAKGIAAPGGQGEPLTYCDLGCGQGFTANLIAAANPRTEVFAIDFNPTHIASGRGLATAAGLHNIQFREAAFDDLLHDGALPSFDVIALHGVYSWISAENRQAIIAFIRQRLKPGGLAYISYDTMPGWAGMAPLRRVLVQHASAGGVSEAALEQALTFADKLKKLDARFYRMYPIVSAQLDRLRKLPRSYLAHELLTRSWQAFSFADVAAELADAKLTYLGSAYLVDHVDRINFTESQQRFLAQIVDPQLAETTRDMIIGRQFRRDIFVKGFTPLAPLQARERWLQTRLALSVAAEDLQLTFQTALGTLALRPDVYKPVIDVLDQGPMTVRELIDHLPANQLGWTSLTDAIMVLVGRGELHPALPSEGQAERAVATSAFNAAVMTRAKESTELGYLASPVTGGGIRVDRIGQLYLLVKQKGLSDPAGAMARIAIMSGHAVVKDGKKLPPEEATAALVARAAEIEQHTLPVLARLGIASRAVEKPGTRNL